jgi:hypothetical protein
MYEKTTERSLSLSLKVLSLFFLLSSSLRQSVFRLNKYVVTPKEYKTLFPSQYELTKKQAKKRRGNRTPNDNHETRETRVISFFCCFFEKSDQTTKMDHIRRLTALFASLETRKCAHFYIISRDKRRTRIGNDARKLSPIVLSYKKKTNRDKRRRRILHNNGVTNRRLCRRRRGD